MEETLKEELRFLALNTRDQLDLTQSKMAEKLVMSVNSYSDIETGAHMCGALTTVLLLAEQEDPKSILQEFKEKLDKFRKKDTKET